MFGVGLHFSIRGSDGGARGIAITGRDRPDRHGGDRDRRRDDDVLGLDPGPGLVFRPVAVGREHRGAVARARTAQRATYAGRPYRDRLGDRRRGDGARAGTAAVLGEERSAAATAASPAASPARPAARLRPGRSPRWRCSSSSCLVVGTRRAWLLTQMARTGSRKLFTLQRCWRPLGIARMAQQRCSACRSRSAPFFAGSSAEGRTSATRPAPTRCRCRTRSRCCSSSRSACCSPTLGAAARGRWRCSQCWP